MDRWTDVCPLQQLRTQLIVSSPCNKDELFFSVPCNNDEQNYSSRPLTTMTSYKTRQEISQQKWKVIFDAKELWTPVTVPHRHKLSTSSKPLRCDLTSLISDSATFVTAGGECITSLTDKGLNVTLTGSHGVPTDPQGSLVLQSETRYFMNHSKGSQYIKQPQRPPCVTLLKEPLGCQILGCSWSKTSVFWTSRELTGVTSLAQPWS